jgi:hypothetical protein
MGTVNYYNETVDWQARATQAAPNASLVKPRYMRYTVDMRWGPVANASLTGRSFRGEAQLRRRVQAAATTSPASLSPCPPAPAPEASAMPNTTAKNGYCPEWHLLKV